MACQHHPTITNFRCCSDLISDQNHHRHNNYLLIIIITITWTGCCSDLTASAAEIEPTLDRWTAGRPGNGPEDYDDDDDDCDDDDDNHHHHVDDVVDDGDDRQAGHTT